jgi:hypothetical protein
MSFHCEILEMPRHVMYVRSTFLGNTQSFADEPDTKRQASIKNDLCDTLTATQAFPSVHHAADASHPSTDDTNADDGTNSHDQIVSHAEPSHPSETTKHSISHGMTLAKCASAPRKQEDMSVVAVRNNRYSCSSRTDRLPDADQ